MLPFKGNHFETQNRALLSQHLQTPAWVSFPHLSRLQEQCWHPLPLLLFSDCSKPSTRERESWAVKRKKKNSPTPFLLHLGSFSIDFCCFPPVLHQSVFLQTAPPPQPHRPITTTSQSFCQLSPPGRILIPSSFHAWLRLLRLSAVSTHPHLCLPWGL